MTNVVKRTPIYLVCFHSTRPDSLRGSSGQYRVVETAIQNDEWPYDNGDDPSFYVARRRGGLLTWGVCRQDLRNALKPDSIVVFFSYSPNRNGEISYRLCAVATVKEKLDHRAVHRENRFSEFRTWYINGLIAPEGDGWRHAEDDRPRRDRHRDWLWRIARHSGLTVQEFNEEHAAVYRAGRFRDDAALLAENYIVFSTPPDRGFISPDPPEVAVAREGSNERWTDHELQALTVCTAAAAHKDKRSYLRIANPSGQNVHRQLRFEMPVDKAIQWRDELISLLTSRSS